MSKAEDYLLDNSESFHNVIANFEEYKALKRVRMPMIDNEIKGFIVKYPVLNTEDTMITSLRELVDKIQDIGMMDGFQFGSAFADAVNEEKDRRNIK